MECTHLSLIRDVKPGGTGCIDCLKTGDTWVHLRICRTCGYVGCCDNSINKHASKHFTLTNHPVIQSFEPDEVWGYCYIDKIFFKKL